MSSPIRKKTERELCLYYVYGFFLAHKPFTLREKGLEGKNKVFPLSYRNLGALVSQVPVAEYSEQALQQNLQDLGWVTPRAAHHEHILKAALPSGPLMPVRFCTLYRSRARLLSVLRSHYADFCAFLTSVHDREEWEVKIYINTEAGKRLAQEANPALQALEKRISSASTGEGYFLKKRREQLLREEGERSLAVWTDTIYAQLVFWAVAGQPTRLLDRQVTGKNVDMIFKAAFLIDQANAETFVAKLDQLAAEYTPQGFFFEMSGPWPAYHFCPSPDWHEGEETYAPSTNSKTGGRNGKEREQRV